MNANEKTKGVKKTRAFLARESAPRIVRCASFASRIVNFKLPDVVWTNGEPAATSRALLLDEERRQFANPETEMTWIRNS